MDLLQSEKPSGRQGNADQCVEWLRSELKEEKAVAEIKSKAERKGFSKEELNDARMKLGVEAIRVDGIWHWRKL